MYNTFIIYNINSTETKYYRDNVLHNVLHSSI